MDNAKLCTDWNISDLDRYDLTVEILNPTPERLDNGLIFFQWHFSFKGEGGYIGFQLTKTGKKAIFSIWQPIKGCMGELIDEHDKPVYRCLHDYPWELNKRYNLTVRLEKEENNGRWWVGEILDYENGTSTIVGRILIPKQFEKLKGYNYYTSIETGYFEDESTIPDIKVKYSGSIGYKNSDEYPLRDKLRKFTVFMIDKSEKSKVVINNDLSYILEAGGRIVS